jgi:hypothetical protein
MKTPFSIHNLVRARPPLTIEQLADWWTKKNVGAIAEIALKSMADPVGTAYDVPPLRIIVFETLDARILYRSQLQEAARAQRARHVVEHAIGQHIEELVFFAREQFLTALLSLDAQPTFQRNQFAVREGVR